MFKFKSKKQVVPDLPKTEYTEYSETAEGASKTCGRFYRSKGFIVAACLALVLGMAVNARSTAIWNFPVLTALIPGVITTAITTQLQTIQDNLIAQFKKATGNAVIAGLKGNLTDNTTEKLLSNVPGAATFPQLTDMFGTGTGKTMGNLAPYNETTFSSMVSKAYSVPSLTNGAGEYMGKIRDISLLLAGPGSGGTSTENNKLSLVDIANKKTADVLTQSRISSFESAGSAAYMAQKLKEAAKNIDVSTTADANNYPEQAIKDMAKLQYYLVMLKAEQLQMQAKEIQRASIMNR